MRPKLDFRPGSRLSVAWTLVEVVIALTVLSIGILGLVMSLSSSLLATDANARRSVTMNGRARTTH